MPASAPAMQLLICLTIAAFAEPAMGVISATSYMENFDGPGGFAGSRFSTTITSGSGTYASAPLGTELGAQDPIGTQLPIAAGGDNEARFYEAGPAISGTGGYAFGEAIGSEPAGFQIIEGYIGFGRTDNLGTLTGRFLLRSSHSGTADSIDGFSAGVGISSPTRLSMVVSRITGGISQTLASSTEFIGGDLYSSVYRVQFVADGSRLTANFWHVEEQPDGSLTETHLDTLTSLNSSYPTGQPGLRSFARSTDSIFYDDIRFSIPEPAIGSLAMLSLFALAVRRRR